MVQKKKLNKSMSVRTNSSNKTPRSIISIIVLLVVVILISSLVTILIIKNQSAKPFDVKTLNYDFQVTPNVSFVLDSDILHFGGGPVGSRLQRSIDLSSSRTAIVKVSWVGDGELIISKNNFLVSADNPFNLSFYMDIPSNYSLGNYSGEIKFKFYDFN